MKRLIVILSIMSLCSCRQTPGAKWYYSTLDSLGKLEVPLILDTALVKKHFNGRHRMDTIINDEMIFMSEYRGREYTYRCFHKDSLIANIYKYDYSDGKLKEWSRYFVATMDDGSKIPMTSVDFQIFYKKNGKIENFIREELGYPGVPLPKFTIHHLLKKLQPENINMQRYFSIEWLPTDPHETLYIGDVSYPKWNWEVRVVFVDHYIGNNPNFPVELIHCREFDSDTGEVVREWYEDWHRKKVDRATK
jgi:hypothetical protein